MASPGGPLSLQDIALARPALSISGSITDLQAGQPAALVLTLTNRSDVGVDVQTVRARVTGASDGCAVSVLQVQPWRGQITVPGHGEATVSLPLQLDADAVGCDGAVWQLDYLAS